LNGGRSSREGRPSRFHRLAASFAAARLRVSLRVLEITMLAKIYRPTKTAMQSGQAAARRWVLEFEPGSGITPDPLMGWSSSSDMSRQVKLFFETRDQAIDYARRHNLPHQVVEPKERQPVLKAYGDNFSARRKEPWSH
jgi:hypothetical protein